jgi:hypothetical protein
MTYTWTDNAMQSGTACNVDTANENLMYLKYNATSLPPSYQASAPPVYASTSSFTVASIICMDSTNTYAMINTSSITVSTGTVGAVNGIAQSSALSGTIAYSSSSTTVTGTSTSFSTEFAAGDVLYDTTNSVAVGVVASVTNNTSLTLAADAPSTHSGASFVRGGLAPKACYFLYAIYNGTTANLLLSTRSVATGGTLVDLPSGYTYYRQIPFAFVTNSSGYIPSFYISQWGITPIVRFSEYTTNLVSNSLSATSFTAQSLSAFVPPISTEVELVAYQSGGNGVIMYIRATGSGDTNGRIFGSTDEYGAEQTVPALIQTNSSQSIDYKVNAQTWSLYVTGYTINGYIC